LFSCNLFNSIPIAFGDAVSSNNVARLCGISNDSGNQQHIEIDVLILNLIDFPGTKSAPFGFSNFRIDPPILSPPLDLSTPEAKKKTIL
jgi:hypothetical protein